MKGRTSPFSGLLMVYLALLGLVGGALLLTACVRLLAGGV